MNDSYGDWEPIPSNKQQAPDKLLKFVDKVSNGEEILLLFKSDGLVFAADCNSKYSPFENVYDMPKLIECDNPQFQSLYEIFSKFSEEQIIINYCSACKHWTLVKHTDAAKLEKCAVCGAEYYSEDALDGNFHIAVQLRKGNNMGNDNTIDNQTSGKFDLSDLSDQEVKVTYMSGTDTLDVIGILLGFNIEMQMLVLACPIDIDAYNDEKDTDYYKKLIPLKFVKEITYED